MAVAEVHRQPDEPALGDLGHPVRELLVADAAEEPHVLLVLLVEHLHRVVDGDTPTRRPSASTTGAEIRWYLLKS